MPSAGLDVVSKVLARPATVWLALANLNAPPFAMSAKFQSGPASADGAGRGGLGCARGAAAKGGGAAAIGAGRWGRRGPAAARGGAAGRPCPGGRRAAGPPHQGTLPRARPAPGAPPPPPP